MTLPRAKSEGANGVIDMGLLNVIRRLRLRQGLAIREIERRTGVSRNTIKKHLKADTVESRFATPERSSHGLRRSQDDHGLARPTNPPLPHPGNRQRQLPLQGKHSRSRQKKEGVKPPLTHD